MIHIPYIYFSIVCLFWTLGYRKFIKYFVALGVTLNFIMEGLRWNTGTDWHAYLYHYQNIENLPENYNYFEPGYHYLVKFSTNNELPYNFILIVAAGVTNYFIHWKIYKLFNNPLTLLVTISSLIMFLGSSRQCVAVALTTYGLILLRDRKSICSIAYLSAACFFHSTAVLGVIYFIINKYTEGNAKERLSIALIATIVVGAMSSYYLDIFSQYNSYIFHEETNSNNSNKFLGLMRIITLGCIIYFINKESSQRTQSLYVICLLLIFYVLGNSVVKTADSRLSLYLYPYFVCSALYSNYAQLTKNQQLCIYLAICSFFLIPYLRNPYPGLFYPYYSIFDMGIIGDEERPHGTQLSW